MSTNRSRKFPLSVNLLSCIYISLLPIVRAKWINTYRYTCVCVCVQEFTHMNVEALGHSWVSAFITPHLTIWGRVSWLWAWPGMARDLLLSPDSQALGLQVLVRLPGFFDFVFKHKCWACKFGSSYVPNEQALCPLSNLCSTVRVLFCFVLNISFIKSYTFLRLKQNDRIWSLYLPRGFTA